MADLTFKTLLSKQQVDENFKNIDFFSGIMEGLKEALLYEKSERAPQVVADIEQGKLP